MSNGASFSLGYNFDPVLIERISSTNALAQRCGVIVEVFGALPSGPIPSARPTSRIPPVSMNELAEHAAALSKVGVRFNYLLNTSARATEIDQASLVQFVDSLLKTGIQTLTVGSLWLMRFLKQRAPNVQVVASLTMCLATAEDVRAAADAGADAIYLDGSRVNRNFRLLRALVAQSHVDLRLYANISCISGCPVIREHYAIFSRQQNHAAVAAANDGFFAGCSLVKLRHPVEWVQTPWIRPEDIHTYVDTGISHFKLSDRLASTDVLMTIASSYVRGQSPPDLFEIIERDGTKYRLLGVRRPFRVDSSMIPRDFVLHFANGDCTSADPSCEYCQSVASEAIKRSALEAWCADGLAIPAELLKRSNR